MVPGISVMTLLIPLFLKPNWIGLLATLLIPVMLSPVVILVLAGQFLWGNLYAGVALVAGWVVVTALLTFPLTHMAAALLARRREQVGLVAQIR